MSNALYKDSREGYIEKKVELNELSIQRPFTERMNRGISIDKEDILAMKMEEYRAKEIKKAKGLDDKGETITADSYLPAKPFYDVKKEIEDSFIHKVFKKMPKGGLLHVHSAAALSAAGLIKLLKEWSHDKEEPQIGIITNEIKDQDSKVIVEPGTLVYMPQLIKILSSECREIGEYLYEAKNEQTLTKYLTINKSMEDKDVWIEFNHIFARTSSLFKNKKFYRKYHEAFFQECLNDKIHYVEMRSGFEEFTDPAQLRETPMIYERIPEYTTDRHLYYQDSLLEVNPVKPKSDFLDALMEAVQVVNSKPTGGINLKVILNARRSLNANNDKVQLSQKIDAAIVLKNIEKYKELIIGFDFVSEEDRGQTTASYANEIIYRNIGDGYELEGIPEFEWWNKPRIQKIRFFLHDGESNWNDDNNVLDAAIISKHRIGHGFNMNKFMEMTDQILKDDGGHLIQGRVIEPVLEICPISNQLLRYIPDLRNHPAYELMKKGIGCVICNDDPQILDNPGLSFDFYEAYMGMQLSLADIKAMVLTAYCYREYDYYKDDSLDKAYGRVVNGFIAEWTVFIKDALTLIPD